MTTGTHLPHGDDAGRLLDEVLQHAPVGVVMSDLDLTIADVNQALCAMIGYTREELLGRKLTEVYHPDDLADALARTADLREGRSGSYVVNRRFITRSGEYVHAKVSASIVPSKTGERLYGVAFVENVTDRVAIETALLRSQVHYRRVVEDQTELIVRCLPDGTRTFVNEAYCRYNRTTAAELVGTSFFTCMNDDERELVQAKFAALSPSNPVITDQHWVIGPGGTMRWHEWTDRGFFDEAGRLVELQSVGRDLTEEHEAQQRVVASEARYRYLFDNLPVAVWESDWSTVTAELARRGLTSSEAMVAAVAADPNLYYELRATVRVTTANPAALAMAGAQSVEEFDHWLARAPTPDATIRFARIVPPLVFGAREFAMDEYTLIRANGEPIVLLLRIARSRQWGGDAFTMFTIAVDVTERKHLQQELEHKQELTERAEAATHLGSWEWRPDGDRVYGSAEFWRILDGRDGGGPNERPVSECIALLNMEDIPAAVEFWKFLQQPTDEPREPVIDVDYRLHREDGSIAIASSRMFATYAENGAMIRAFGILRDVTESKRAEEEAARHRDELVRADKMISLGILVSGVAHEINNPNHAIGLNVPLVRGVWRDAVRLIDEVATSSDRDDLRLGQLPWSEARTEVGAMLDDVELASERIRNIVNELRGFGLDHSSGERRRVAVNNVVTSSLRLLGKHIARATRFFTVDLGDDLPFIEGNAQRLEQVVVNLVLNACQALENDQQPVTIRTGFDGQRVFIRVRDEGRGIAPENLANIRTPFFTTKRAQGGTGLGVAVSDRIAGEHGGELTFESTLGHGTTATLWFPPAQKKGRAEALPLIESK